MTREGERAERGGSCRPAQWTPRAPGSPAPELVPGEPRPAGGHRESAIEGATGEDKKERELRR